MSDATDAAQAPLRLDIPTILALGEQTMPDYETMSAAEARAALAALPARPGPDVEEVVDVDLADGLTGRRYVPLDADAGPLVLYYHGGGFTIGNVDTYDGATRRLADSLGLPVISVEYRLAPEHPFPAALDDAWSALAATASSPLAAGLVVAGDSAGANLAAVVARRAARDGVALRHQLLVYPCLDPARSSPSHGRTDSDTSYLSSADMGWYWRQYLDGTDAAADEAGATGDERIDPRVAPPPAGLAPATIALAGRDPLHDEGADYARLLAAAGVPVTTFDYPALFHGFAGFAGLNDEAEAALLEIVAAVREALGLEPRRR